MQEFKPFGDCGDSRVVSCPSPLHDKHNQGGCLEPIPVYRAAHLQPYLHYLKGLGAPVERELRRARLPALLSNDIDLYLPSIPTVSFLKAISRREGIDALGLRALRSLTIDDLSTQYVAMARRSPTLWAAFERFCELGPIDDASLRAWMAASPDDGIKFCTLSWCDRDAGGMLFEDWNLLLVLIAIVREFAGPAWQPDEMGFRSDTAPSRFASEQFPNTRFLAGQRATFINVPRKLLGLPHRTRTSHEESDRASSAAHVDANLPELDLVGSLEAVLSSYVSEHLPSIDQAAEMAGTSVRTLQRRLKAAGVNYSDLIRDIRGSAAIRLLRETDTSVLEIALDLGFDDPSHFARAFRHFAGMSPREFRRQQRMNQRAL